MVKIYDQFMTTVTPRMRTYKYNRLYRERKINMKLGIGSYKSMKLDGNYYGQSMSLASFLSFFFNHFWAKNCLFFISGGLNDHI